MHGGKNVILPFVSFCYEEWLYYANENFKINGNLSSGISSGLYSQKDFEDGAYRYYWTPLNRDKEGDSDQAKSINISGVNNSKVRADYIIFVVSSKSMDINCSTGKVIRS